MYDTICCNCMAETNGRDRCSVCRAPFDFENEPPALQPRTMLHNRYLIGKCLGRGGFGLTYLGLDVELRMRVAIKEFFPRRLATRGTNQTQVIPSSDKDYAENYQYGLEKFLEEAQLLAHFNHPNIVPILYCFQENNTAYFVMRYIAGTTLENYVKEAGRITEDELVHKIMLPVLDALQVVHDANTLHRDIKPQNIFLAEDGHPLLLDFGAARQAMQDENHTVSVFFTPGYAPIEQYPSGKKPGKGNLRQGAWTDVYACAATLYSCLRAQIKDGRLEPPPEPPARILENDTLIPIQNISRVKLSSVVARAIRKGLEVESDKRPQTIAEFRKLLTEQESNVNFEVLVLLGEFQGQCIPLSSKPLIIGKDLQQCALVFTDKLISRKHCQISIVKGRVYVQDLNSLNGTWINDERQPEAWLKAGDRISLAGRVVLQVVEAPKPKTALPEKLKDIRHWRWPNWKILRAETYRRLWSQLKRSYLNFSRRGFHRR